MESDKVYITKLSGNKELFSSVKLKKSLLRSGATEDITKEIVNHVEAELGDEITTTKIYNHAFSLLKKIQQQTVAARYSMRRAVFGLGPSGFPFEDYIAEIFRANGYTINSQRIIIGECAIHEVDMIAHKGDEYIGAEIKFHNKFGIKTDLKTALYVRERFEDIKKGVESRKQSLPINKGMLITNTKFTKHTISYAKCAGLSLLSWNYPKKGNLEELIRSTGVYPVTVLTSLSKAEKTSLLEQKVVLCSDLNKKVYTLKKAGLSSDKMATVLNESQALCHPLNIVE